ncbi:uncharacterized protein LOC127856382 [Dreissena polymorpha]|uniref:uncharacterized protein LOC127856382 n=1 Tax=Dreissena polymorpha TaxID=45954 RepID=UPI002264DD18|nr:uncharacterized protein LOC127856382 [Dreissena polymorpha]
MLKKLENNWNTNWESLQVSYNDQLHEKRRTHKKMNTILDEIKKKTLNELDDKMTNLKVSLKTIVDNCIKLKNELKRLSGAIHDLVDKGIAELSFIANKKCLEQVKQSEAYRKENSVKLESLLTFHADKDIEQFFSTLSGLGRIVLVDQGQFLSVQ